MLSCKKFTSYNIKIIVFQHVGLGILLIRTTQWWESAKFLNMHNNLSMIFEETDQEEGISI